MQKTIHFDIASHCSESWDQMTPQTRGRFCGSCQKTVVDFTVPTPAGHLPIHPEDRRLMGDTIMTAEKPPVTIQGRVMVDSSEHPASYVRITFGRKKAVAADAEGYFKIPARPPLRSHYHANPPSLLPGVYFVKLLHPALPTAVILTGSDLPPGTCAAGFWGVLRFGKIRFDPSLGG